jgi:hypothetical protein
MQLPPNTAAHHLVATTSGRSLQFMLRAYRAGYDINRSSNGEALPTDGGRADSPLHSGGHLDSYYDAVGLRETALEIAYFKDAAAGRPWTDEALLAAMKDLEDGLRRDLLDPKHPLRLQANCPYKNQGVRDLIANELKDARPETRLRALRLLGANDPAVAATVPELPKALVAALQDTDMAVRDAAVTGLLHLGRSATAGLQEAIAQDPNGAGGKKARELLERIRSDGR